MLRCRARTARASLVWGLSAVPGVLRTILRGVVAASLAVVPASAVAAPPEGCVGFPDIPEAWICVTSWTPQNVAPRAGTSDGATFVVPQFCAFSECVGPTPVTVPGVYAGQGGGAIATITYRGETYTVPVAVAPAVRLSGSVSIACFGCGPSVATFNGVFTGVVAGHSYAGASLTGVLGSNTLASTCLNPAPYTVSSMSGTLTVSDGSRSDAVPVSVTMGGSSAFVWFNPVTSGSAVGVRLITSPLVNACDKPATMYLDVAGVLIA